MRTKESELIKSWVELAEFSLRSGEWHPEKCAVNPYSLLKECEGFLLEQGYRRDSLCGEEFLFDG